MASLPGMIIIPCRKIVNRFVVATIKNLPGGRQEILGGAPQYGGVETLRFQRQ